MCGIAGIVYRDGTTARPDHIALMLDAIKHRGPDGEGTHIAENIALGHRRLAIIDLVTGSQPMSNEDGSVWVTFNGEIYNYKTLRDSLENRGHLFKTQSDTEVIVHLFEDYGTELVHHLRGMFAFGIADFSKKILMIARDHFGIKPLYYRFQPHFFTFASELPALRTFEESLPTGDLGMVDIFLRFSYIPSPNTIFKDIFKLNPASYMVVSFSGEIIEQKPYWIPEIGTGMPGKNEISLDKIESVLEESVSAHLVSDVPFGVLLSGGVDSSLVAIKMAKVLPSPVTSFTIDFEDNLFSEKRYADSLAETFHLYEISQMVREDSLEILPDLISHFGEPFGDPSIIPTWHVARIARSRVPMVLSGDGGDETFAGYLSYIQWRNSYSLRHILKLFSQNPPAGIHLLGGFLVKKIQAFTKYRSYLWEKNVRFSTPSLRKKIWRREFRYLADRPADAFETQMLGAGLMTTLGFAQSMDYRTYLPSDILSKVDIMSMYHGLEVRTPLIDREMIQCARRIPDEQKIGTDERGDPVTKAILRKILSKYMPKDYVYRPKWGFVPPYRNWFLPGGRARTELEEKMKDTGSHLRRWFNPSAISDLLEDQSRGRDRSLILWLLLVLAIWSDQNRDIRFE